MTNAEKYLRDGVDPYMLASAFNLWCFNNKGIGRLRGRQNDVFSKGAK